jgi:hypothetical protein
VTLHIIGDSHAGHSYKDYPGAIIHQINSRSMHGVYNQGLKPCSYGVNGGDIVLWVFAEIDCRHLILKVSEEQGRLSEEVASELADNFLHHIQKHMDRLNFRSIVSCVVPPSNLRENPDYPFRGTLAERVAVTKYLNFSLKWRCDLFSIPYLDWYSHFALEDGSLDHSRSDGHVHLNPAFNAPCHESLTLALTAMS